MPLVISELFWNEMISAQMMGATPNRPMNSTAGDTNSQPATWSLAKRRSRSEARPELTAPDPGS